MLLAIPQLVLASKTHVVRKSESLHTIARKYHVSVEELKSVNNLSGTHVQKGAKVIIPSHPETQIKKQKIAEKPNNYKVVRGDTLPGIAKKTGIKMSDIRRLNGLKGNKIKAGQMLALADTAIAGEEAPRTVTAANRLQLVNRDLLNEQEFSNTLAELTDIDSDRPVDLAKSLEENSASANKIKKAPIVF
jgi:LysM repeat protein